MNGLEERSWVPVFCLVCLIVLFSNLHSAALIDPDEGRNAEKAREMLLLDDWVTPHQNFLPILDKPIFFYWLLAISFNVFGLSEWAARLPSSLAALACVFLVYRFARERWGSWEALWSSLILLTSMEFFILARVVILDMTLTMVITTVLYAFFSAVETTDDRARKVYCWIMYAAAGIGTLVKGPIALAIPIVIGSCYLLVSRKWSLLGKLNLVPGILVFAAIVTPWYLYVEARNPGYLRYFLWEEHVLRYVTRHFGRSHGWYYFFLVALVGLFPWTFLLPFLVRKLWHRALDDTTIFLSLWVSVPMLVFSLSSSKMPHYILPVYPPLALLTGRTIALQFQQRPGKRWSPLFAPCLAIFATMLFALVGAAWPDLFPKQVAFALKKYTLLAVLVYFLLISVVFGVFIFRNLTQSWKNQRTAYICMSVGLALFYLFAGQMMAAASYRRSSKPLAEAAASLVHPEDRLVFFSTYPSGFPFYLRVTKPIWVVEEPEKQQVMGSFYVGEQHPAAMTGYGRVLFTYEEFAQQWRKDGSPLKIIVKEKNLEHLTSEVGRLPKILLRFNGYLIVTNR